MDKSNSYLLTLVDNWSSLLLTLEIANRFIGDFGRTETRNMAADGRFFDHIKLFTEGFVLEVLLKGK